VTPERVDPEELPILLFNADDCERLAEVPEGDDQLCTVRGLVGGCFGFAIVGNRLALGWLIGHLDSGAELVEHGPEVEVR
jgi:hypothetical protein